MTNDLVTPQLPAQFPINWQVNNKGFVDFIQAYYEWMQQTGQYSYSLQNFLNYMDIDETLDQFLAYFQFQFMNIIPSNIAVINTRLLMKHIVNLYQSKGTPRGFQLLFRILFNDDINLYIPGQYMFRCSDNDWIEKKYIEVFDSPYLANLVGNIIYTPDANALVEDFSILTHNSKVVNILTLSAVNGVFKYGDFILCRQIPNMTIGNGSPQVVGSLSAVSMIQGGAYFKLGDLVNISGNYGTGALGRVASITTQNGELTYSLKDGGFGYTMNAQITVVGGGGSGGSFTVGSLVNQEVLSINVDDAIIDFYNTYLDIANAGFTLSISNSVESNSFFPLFGEIPSPLLKSLEFLTFDIARMNSVLPGSFILHETVSTSINAVSLDFAYLPGSTNIVFGEALSNTSLDLNNLIVTIIDNPSYVTVTGSEAMLNSANLIGGIILEGASGNSIYINCKFPKQTYKGSGIVSAVNSTSITVTNANSYFLVTGNVVGSTSGANAYINQVTRNTDWDFPNERTLANLDAPLNLILTYEDITIGTIADLAQENPGNGYAFAPEITIIEPLIYQLQIPDGRGGIWGYDANVIANTSIATGIITSLQIIDSGYGFQPFENVLLYANSPYVASGVAIVDSTGIKEGYWDSNKSFVSDVNKLQDSYYYQIFSYEIQAPRMLATYQAFVDQLMGPVGYLQFGRFTNFNLENAQNQITYTSTIQYDTANSNNVIYSGG